ncbi:unnamed protein product [Menidia menidia]|uniref:(Atlantic silverside) hypothetical protein n=1 Tax=Menidia menidia TaxID=238744 RepID=A0A8S4BUC4_9TELE|nr:unnamed protein product [Menidia menidia]
MASSWVLLLTTASALVFLSLAHTDEHMLEQREYTFEEIPDSFLLQKEVDLADLLDPKQFPVEQVIVEPPKYGFRGESSSGGFLTPRGRRPSFGPRSLGGPAMLDYPVQFPLSRPTSDNIQAICLYRDQRPRYPHSYFPASGFGQQKRQAEAVNNAEAWFDTCCKENQTSERDVTLCCATQAWELSVSLFCEKSSSVKDRLYHCCKQTGSDILNCFNNDSPNPSYGPTEELPVLALPPAADFTFEPNACERTPLGQYGAATGRRETMGKPDIMFPLGRPTPANIGSLCSNQKLRPLYDASCLQPFHHHLALEVKVINRLERQFKKCCKRKRGALSCADQKWRQEISKFCVIRNAENLKMGDHCCYPTDGDIHACFQKTSPDPHYNMTAAPQELQLSNVCDIHSIITDRFPVGFPLNTFVSQCCPLPEQERNSCSVSKLKEITQNLCSSEKTSSEVDHRCCKKKSPEEISQCVSKSVMDAVAKATNIKNQKKRKRCPIS